jgi:hypothetical protein
MDRPGHENDRAFYCEAWNGTGAYTYDRIGRGTLHIRAACVSVLGGIQPGPLERYLREVFGGRGDDGLIQRFQLAVWPDVAGRWRNVDRAQSGGTRARRAGDGLGHQAAQSSSSASTGHPRPAVASHPDGRSLPQGVGDREGVARCSRDCKSPINPYPLYLVSSQPNSASDNPMFA